MLWYEVTLFTAFVPLSLCAPAVITTHIKTLVTVATSNTSSKLLPEAHHIPERSSAAPDIRLSIRQPESCADLHCNWDNCLRALARFTAQNFCSNFTDSVVTSTSGLRLYATQCTASTISRLSSACTCLNGCLPISSSPLTSLA